MSKKERETNVDTHDVVTVCTTRNAIEAEMVRNLLEAEGIKATVVGASQAGFAGILEIPVVVQAADAERAAKLVAAQGHFRPDREGREPSRSDSHELVTVQRCRTAPDAEIVKNFLESEGIKAKIAGETQAGLTGIVEIPILVHAIDADKAVKLLASHGHFKSPMKEED